MLNYSNCKQLNKPKQKRTFCVIKQINEKKTKLKQHGAQLIVFLINYFCFSIQ